MSSSLQGFGLNHTEVLLKLQESGCSPRLAKVGTASGFPLVRQESTDTWWLGVTTGLDLGPSAWSFRSSPVGYQFISIIYYFIFFSAGESNSNSASVSML